MKEIKARTVYTKENFLEFQKYHYFHNVKIARIFFTLFGILFCGLGVIGFFMQDYSFAIIEIILGVFLILEFNTSIIPVLQSKSILKSDSLTIGLENNFIFYENEFEVNNEKSSSKMSYQELYKVEETNRYIYLYINKMSAFLVNKEEIEENRGEELVSLLKEKCLKKK